MRGKLTAALVFGAALGAGAAELPAVQNYGWESRPAVTGDASHLIRRSTTEDMRRGTPVDAQISAVVRSDLGIAWQPVWRRDGAGGIAVPLFGVAPDCSGIWLAERIGAAAGPNSTLVVTGNQYSGELASGVLLEECKLTLAFWSGKGARLIAVEAAQPELERPARLVEIDPHLGITGAWTLEGREVSAIAPADSEHIWLAADGQLYRFALADGTARRVAETTGGRVALASLPAERRLWVAEAGRLRLLDSDGRVLGEWARRDSEPVEMAAAGSDGVLIRDGGERLELLHGGTLTELSMPATAIAWVPAVGRYAVAWRHRQSLELLEPSGASGGVDGRSRIGVIAGIFPMPGPDGSVVVWSNTGKFARMTPLRRSFRSSEIYPPK